MIFFFFFSSRRRHTRFDCDWSSDVCSSDLNCGGRAAKWRGRRYGPRPPRRCCRARTRERPAARTGAAPAAVPGRCGQRAAGDDVVGDLAEFGARLAAADSPAGLSGRLDARIDHAVPGAATLHLRLPAHRVPALAWSAGAVALALPACRAWPAWRTAARAGGPARLPAPGFP